MSKDLKLNGNIEPDSQHRPIHTGWLENYNLLTDEQKAAERRSHQSERSQKPEPRVDQGRVWTDEHGELRFSPAQQGRWGLTPGTEFLADETPDGIILRRADPALAKVIVEPTSACNLNCRTCVRHSWDEPIGSMSMATYRALIAGLRDVPTLRTIALWGIGEPLVHPDIVEMVRLAHDLGVRTEMITNGLLLTEQMAERLIVAGLDRVVVSIDGVTPEAQADVRSGASLQRVRRNILTLHDVRDRLDRENPEVGLEFVLLKRNLSELPGLRDLARDLEAKSVIVTGVLPYSAELADETMYGLWAGKTYGDPSTWSPEILLPKVDARREALEPVVKLLEYAGVVGSPAARRKGATGYCRFVAEGTAAVSWDGQLSPCVGLLHSYSCYVNGRQKRMRRYRLGSVADEPIGEIWGKEEYRAFRKRVLDFSFAPCTDCGACEMAETNETDCYNNPFPVCGDCLWAKGVIQCP
jgi:MoaA/NifB/PqqE/SkfB family radical SAM enzyme